MSKIVRISKLIGICLLTITFFTHTAKHLVPLGDILDYLKKYPRTQAAIYLWYEKNQEKYSYYGNFIQSSLYRFEGVDNEYPPEDKEHPSDAIVSRMQEAMTVIKRREKEEEINEIDTTAMSWMQGSRQEARKRREEEINKIEYVNSDDSKKRKMNVNTQNSSAAKCSKKSGSDADSEISLTEESSDEEYNPKSEKKSKKQNTSKLKMVSL